MTVVGSGKIKINGVFNVVFSNFSSTMTRNVNITQTGGGPAKSKAPKTYSFSFNEVIPETGEQFDWDTIEDFRLELIGGDSAIHEGYLECDVDNVGSSLDIGGGTFTRSISGKATTKIQL